MNDASETRAPREIITEATCNRFGEELGQRLETLVWPQVPDVWKDLFGKVGGRIAPLDLLMQRLFGGTKTEQILEHQPNLSLDPDEIRSQVQQLMSDPDWKLNIISDAKTQNPEAEGDDLRQLVIKFFSARVLENLRLSGSYQLQKNDPRSIELLLIVLLIVQALNAVDLE